MKKYTLAALTIIAPIFVFSLVTQAISTKNSFYLHDRPKAVRSSTQHLNQFIAQGDVILDFYADWCGWCTKMMPILDKVASRMPQFTFIKINRDFFDELKGLFNITSIPTLIFLRDGKEIGRYDGKPLTATELENLITQTYSTN